MDYYTSDSEVASGSLPAKLESFNRNRDSPNPIVAVLCSIALGFLLFTSVFGVILSGVVFSPLTPMVDGECLSQSFVLFASVLALVYVGLHVAAARENFSIMRSQPFQHPLHSWAIIMVRLDLVAWAVALLSVSVAVAKAPVLTILLDLDLFVTAGAFPAIILALCIIERADQPFNLPGLSAGDPSLPPGARLSCRVSDLDVSTEEGISRRSTLTGDGRPMGPRPMAAAATRHQATVSDDVESVGKAQEEQQHARSGSTSQTPTLSRGGEKTEEETDGAHDLAEVLCPPAAKQRQEPGREWQGDWANAAAERSVKSSSSRNSAGTARSDSPGEAPRRLDGPDGRPAGPRNPHPGSAAPRSSQRPQRQRPGHQRNRYSQSTPWSQPTDTSEPIFRIPGSFTE